jgi:DNA-binding NarL/FixJ family response regulator
LIAEVRELGLPLACLLMSGHGDEATLQSARAFDVPEILAKPFLLADLFAAIERAAPR